VRQKIGFIGLGRVGIPAARTLLRAGYEIVGYARRPEVIEALKSMGGEAAMDCKEVALKTSTVVIMVLNDQQVIDVVAGDRGVLSGAERNSLVICMSTINRENLELVAEKCKEKGVGFIDCPFTGGPARAESGRLTLIAAAPPDILERSRAMLSVLGDIIHVGETPGMGQAVKHCNQLMVGTTMAAFMETLTMARKGGLDPRLVCEVIGKGIVGSGLFDLLSSSILDHAPFAGSLGQMYKDMDIVINTGKRLRLPLLVATAAHQYFLSGQALGLGDLDGSELIRVIERISDPNAGV
jgi:3-hydroxyisobutyrate dehydrogenase